MFRSAAFHGHMLPVHREPNQHPTAFVYGLYIAVICPVKPEEFSLYLFDDEEKNISRNTSSSGWGVGKIGKKKKITFHPALTQIFSSWKYLKLAAGSEFFFQSIIFKYLPYYHYFLYITVIHVQKQFTI